MKRLVIITGASVGTILLTIVGLLTVGSPWIIRTVLRQVGQRASVTIHVGTVGGSILSPIHFTDVAITTPEEDTLLTADQLSISYRLPHLLRGNLELTQITSDNVRVQMTTSTGSEIDSERRERATRIPNLLIHNVDITNGVLQIQRGDTTNTLFRAHAIALGLTDLTIWDGGDSARVTVTQLRGIMDQPQLELRHFEGDLVRHGDTVRINAPSVALSEATGGVTGWFLASDAMQDFSIDVVVANLTPTDVPVATPWLRDQPYRIFGTGTVSGYDHGERNFASDSLRFSIDGTPTYVRARGGIRIARDGSWVLRGGQVETTHLPLRLIVSLDTTRFDGTIEGRIDATGPSGDLAVDVDMTYVDARDLAVSQLAAGGTISVTHPLEAEFRRLRIRNARLDLRTLQRLSERIPSAGAITISGDVSGGWRAPVFRGILSHTEPGWSSSAFRGEIHGASYANLRIDSLQPHLVHAVLSSDVPLPSVMDGQVEFTRGNDSLHVVALLHANRAGTLTTSGFSVPSVNGTSIRGSFALSHANANAVDTLWPVTSINGVGSIDAELADDRVKSWRIGVALDSSNVDDVLISHSVIALSRDTNEITVDSIQIQGTGFTASARGRLLGDSSSESRIEYDLDIDSLHQLVPIAQSWLPLSLDSSYGAILARGDVTGSQRDFFVRAEIIGQELSRRSARAARLSADIGWRSVDRSFTSTILTDSIALGTFLLTDTRVDVQGSLDSTSWTFQARRPQMGSIYSRGEVRRQLGMHRVRLDTLAVPVGGRTWSSLRPAEISFQDSAFAVDSLVLRVPGRDTRVALNGVISPHASSRLRGRLTDVRLEEIVAFIGGDSTTVGGLVDATMTVTGTLRDPILDVDATISDPRVRSSRFSHATGSMTYANGMFRTNARLSNDTVTIAEVEAELPAWIRLSPVRFEQRDEFLSGQLHAANAPFSIIAPFFPSWRNPQGAVVARATVSGTWSRPIWGGNLAVQDGRVGLPDLGIYLDSIDAQFNLRGDTIVIDRFSMRSGAGTVRVSGNVAVRDIANPQFALSAVADRFTAIERRDYMSMTVTGQVGLRGSLSTPRLTGRGIANRGSLSFADVVEKQIVDLSDPLFASYIDTSVIRQEGLDQVSTSELMRRLQIDTLRVNLGNDFWMRSSEGDVQLTGELTIDKRSEVYRLDGTLTAARGNYRLQLAPGVAREFTVTRGTVQYFGTPDLNADLDIDARHIVRTFGGVQVNINAHLGGTLYQPTVELSSDLRPAVSDAELISYLLFGSPSVQAFAGQGGTQSRFLFQESVDQFAAALSGQLAQSVVRGLGVPLDYLQIKPGDVSRSFSGTEIAIGKQFSFFNRPAFITASPRICPRQSFFSTQNIGASLESRLTGYWSLSASVDPVRICETAVAPLSIRYQLGVDLVWDRR